MSERTLIRKATVITSASAGEVLPDTDILIEHLGVAGTPGSRSSATSHRTGR